jgi:glycerol-3-phosphate dehydrogenase subunit B
VVVIGAGVAGTAAALSASQAGARVMVIDGGTGASTLATGAIDATFWQDAPAQPAPIAGATRKALEALGGYAVPDAGAWLLATSGIVRPARGHDQSLLDVQPSAGQRIGVVRCDRPGWDAQALARAWGDRYFFIDAVVMRYADELELPDADFATRHDERGRIQWLAERLREGLGRAGGRVDALVLPPCLGVDRAQASALSERVGVRCGEPIAAPGGPSGLRFERGRDRAFASAQIEHIRSRAAAVVRTDDGWRVATDGDLTPEGDAVVLATGGLIGGGIEYAPPESVIASALPPSPRVPFRLTVDAPITVGVNDRPLELPSTLFGPAPESLTWPFRRDPLMNRVGALADEDGRAGAGLFVAGDVRADRPRAWLDAFATGVAAGLAAALGAVAAPPRIPSPVLEPPIRP